MDLTLSASSLGVIYLLVSTCFILYVNLVEKNIYITWLLLTNRYKVALSTLETYDYVCVCLYVIHFSFISYLKTILAKHFMIKMQIISDILINI